MARLARRSATIPARGSALRGFVEAGLDAGPDRGVRADLAGGVVQREMVADGPRFLGRRKLVGRGQRELDEVLVSLVVQESFFLPRRARSVFSASDMRLFTVPTGMSRIRPISA